MIFELYRAYQFFLVELEMCDCKNCVDDWISIKGRLRRKIGLPE